MVEVFRVADGKVAEINACY
jgi:hypothetical protein